MLYFKHVQCVPFGTTYLSPRIIRSTGKNTEQGGWKGAGGGRDCPMSPKKKPWGDGSGAGRGAQEASGHAVSSKVQDVLCAKGEQTKY